MIKLSKVICLYVDDIFCLKAEEYLGYQDSTYKTTRIWHNESNHFSKLMNMPTDKLKVHLQKLVLSEMSASAVPQFNAEAEFRSALYTGNSFFYTKKAMIMFTTQQKIFFLFWSQSVAYFSSFFQWPTWIKPESTHILNRQVLKEKKQFVNSISDQGFGR